MMFGVSKLIQADATNSGETCFSAIDPPPTFLSLTVGSTRPKCKGEQSYNQASFTSLER
jgi:hypothetical protein